MKYEIITDRFEIEKMAEGLFLSKDQRIVPIDYADLRTLRKIGAFKKAIIFDIDTFEEEWTDKFIENVKSLQLPLDSLRAFMMNYIACDEDLLLYSDIIKLWQYLTRIKYKDGETDNTFDSFIDCLWSVCVRHSMPKGTLKIQLLVSSEKTEQDKQDDEKYEQMIEEYRKPYFPPLDLPIIELYPNDKE